MIIRLLRKPDMLSRLTKISKEGGRLALKMKRKPLQVISKSDNRWDLFTLADTSAQRRILKQLSRHFPNIPVIAEEDQQHLIPKEDSLFTVDPVDGSIPFTADFDNWGNIIGYLENGQPKCGVIYLPERKQLVTVQRGQGCRLNGKSVSLNYNRPLSETVVEAELGPWVPPYEENPEDRWSVITRLRKKCLWLGGSGFVAAAIANILMGRSGAYVNFNAKIWDFSASILAIEEAGGVAFKPDGSPVTWNEIPMQVIFAANPRLKDELLAIINA